MTSPSLNAIHHQLEVEVEVEVKVKVKVEVEERHLHQCRSDLSFRWL